MNHAETLLKHLQEALDLLYDREPSAVTQVQNALQHLEAITTIDARMEESLKNLREAEVFLDEVVGALQRYGTKIDLTEFDVFGGHVEEITSSAGLTCSQNVVGAQSV